MNSKYTSIIAGLEDAIASGSSEKRVAMLRQVTDLFLKDADCFSDEQIRVFDDVFCVLIDLIGTRARAELSARLAPIDTAPATAIQTLARDDEISVAAPVLTLSPRLTTSDLIEIASTKSQDHLLAICSRVRIASAVANVILDRGERHVVHRLARNAGAEFSDAGYAALTARAEDDDELAGWTGLRLDLPIRFLRELLERASEAVRAQLLAVAPPELRDEIQRVLASIAGRAERKLFTPRDYSAAVRSVMRLKEKGQLTEASILTFAEKKEIEKLGAAIALLSDTPINMIAKLVQSPRNDTLLIPCKATNLRWPTVRMILKNRHPGHTVPEQILQLAQADYIKLSAPVARRTIRFWRVRDKVEYA
ncbi:MAG: DUF2336 domain-containing protein [Xanthobacteraceae bacterium]|nr:MAG: DUF2336 domain-containing protein [Xanthobacteraceae bacterium]